MTEIQPGRRIGIIGRGHVGQALQRGWRSAGYEVRTGGKQPEDVREIGEWAQLVVLAVPYSERKNALKELGPAADNKTLIDVTNALDANMKFQGSTKRSGAEELQTMVRDAAVVKAFNTVNAAQMDKGEAAGEPLSIFVAGDDIQAKQEALELAQAVGFETIDAGPLKNARWLETLGFLNIQLSGRPDLGQDCGFHYVHAGGERQRGGARRPREKQAGHTAKSLESSP